MSIVDDINYFKEKLFQTARIPKERFFELQSSPTVKNSWYDLLLDASQKLIGLNLVPVNPVEMDKPLGMLYYMDFVYPLDYVQLKTRRKRPTLIWNIDSDSPNEYYTDWLQPRRKFLQFAEPLGFQPEEKHYTIPPKIPFI
jgi:hypothetical protein